MAGAQGGDGEFGGDLACENATVRCDLFVGCDAVIDGDLVVGGNILPPPPPGPPGPVGPPGQSAVLGFGNMSIGANADTRFLDAWFGAAQVAKVIEQSAIVAPRAGTLRNFFVRHQSTQGNGNLVTYTVRINGANTPIAVSLATGAIGQASNLVDTAAVAQGDRITVQAMKALAIGGGSVEPTCGMEFA